MTTKEDVKKQGVDIQAKSVWLMALLCVVASALVLPLCYFSW